jgi:uncharacterized membrane protein
VFDSLFSFLFKYQRLVFEQGDFVFGATRSMSLTAVLLSAAAVYAIWTYRSVGAVPARDRAVLIGLRAALFGVMVFALLRPTLLLSVAVPQQNFVGVLLDDSRSMQIADEAGAPRSEFVVNQLGSPEAPLLAQLASRFSLRVFRFSSSAERLQAAEDLSFGGTATRLGDAMDQARDELSGLPVAGLVMVTDGADNAEALIDGSLARMQAEAVPVFTVGVGRDQLVRDVQVTRVEMPRRVLKGTSLVIDVVISQTGYRGRQIPLVVEDAGRIVNTQEITLAADGEAQTVRVRLKATETGPRVFRFRVPPQDGEEVPQNNQRDVLAEVFDTRQKVLYIEGEPRFEPKFVGLATEDDPTVQVVLLQRTAEATSTSPPKYYRRNVDGPEELVDGFPSTREELYGYRAIMLGSIEASAFTADQLRMLEDFVDIRGGGLIALGGHLSLAEGGWGGTALSNALPLALGEGRPNPIDPPIELVVRPTPTGANHPSVQIADGDQANLRKWTELPPVTMVNALGVVKPGANVLLTGTDPRGREHVVLAYQRYGRGKTLLLGVQDTWLWRMHASMAVEDLTHHTFWQRMVRWLVDGVPERVMVTTSPDRVERGDPVAITAEVLDTEYLGINDGRITARVTAPSGRVEEVPMEWTVEHQGEYRARFTPAEDGIYRVAVGGTTKDGLDVGRGESSLRVAPSDAEYFDAAMRAPLLERIAEETDGRFFRASDTSALVDAITYSGRGITVVEERELWDMPILLLALLGLMGGEWLFRRARGLA